MTDFPFTPLQLKWIEALESGTYEQGHGQLYTPADDKNPARYCCLGVGADVCGKLDIDPKNHGLKNHSVLNEEVRGLLQLRTRGGRIRGNKVPKAATKQAELWLLNDAAHWSFAEIAAFMRNYPEAIFTNKEES